MPSLSVHSSQSHCLASPSRVSPRSPTVSTAGSESGERYSRKVFVGGLPPDIDEGNQGARQWLFFSFVSFFFILTYLVCPLSLFLMASQRKSTRVSAGSAPSSWTGRTRRRASPTSRPKDTLSSCSKYERTCDCTCDLCLVPSHMTSISFFGSAVGGAIRSAAD